MSFVSDTDRLQDHFRVEFAMLRSTPIVYQNQPTFNPPEKGSWVKFTVTETGSVQAGFGAPQRLWRNFGIVSVDVYTPQGRGTLEALQIADDAATVLRGKNLGSLLTRSPRLETPDPWGDYFRKIVLVDYYSEFLA